MTGCCSVFIIYESSSSGYFDSRLFAIWFFEILVPSVKDLPGIKILLGDNLASHFNYDIVCACVNLNIKFTMLVPNATDKMQVLDVSVFGPMKKSWRVILTDYRKETRRRGSIEKCYFPQLLCRLVDRMQPKLAANIKSGFRTSGIVPLDRSQVLKKIPSCDITDVSVSTVFNSTLVSLLEENRSSANTKKKEERRSFTMFCLDSRFCQATLLSMLSILSMLSQESNCYQIITLTRLWLKILSSIY